MSIEQNKKSLAAWSCSRRVDICCRGRTMMTVSRAGCRQARLTTGKVIEGRKGTMGELFYGLAVSGGAFAAVILAAFHLDQRSDRRRRRQRL
jgi:hypothetical protein